MSGQTFLQAGGLNTNSNEFETRPGSLQKAQNCVLLAPGVVGCRKGQAAQSYTASAAFQNIWFYGTTPIAHLGTTTLARDTGSAWTNYSGSYTAPDAALMRMAAMEATSNFYFLTDKGAYRLDSVTATPSLAGGLWNGQIFSAATNGTSGYLANGSSVAYRLVFGVVDLNGVRHLGPPSGRFVVSNSAGAARNVTVVFPATNVNSLLTTHCFWQLYRSRSTVTSQTAPDGSTITVSPSDDMYLCQERFFATSEIGTSLTITDTTPDDFLGALLYTNETDGEGILQLNTPPPYAKDLVWWDNRAWYGNVKSNQRVNLQVIGAGTGTDGYTGIRLGDTLTINTNTYVAAGAYSTGSSTFALSTGGTAANNIQDTTRSLVNLINAVSTTELAEYTSPSINEPGKFSVWSRDLSSSAWNVTLTTKLFPIASGNLSRAGGTTVTCTTTGDHGLATGDTVRIDPTGTADANFPALTTAAITVTGATTFTYAQNGANVVSVQPYTERRITPNPAFAWNPPPPPSLFSVAVGGLVRTGGTTVTVTTSVAHGLSVGMAIPLVATNGNPDAAFAEGTKTVITVASTTSFTYTEAGSNTTSTVAYQSGARVTSDPSTALNGLMYSKDGEPEAVPWPENSLTVGVPDKQILRIVPLGNNLFVFKQEGIWVVSGTAGSYRLDILDPTVHTYAPDSVVSVSNRIYGLTNQGVVATSSSGCEIVSDEIEQDLFQYFGSRLSAVRVQAFGVAHETDRLYSLWLPYLTADSDAPAVYQSGRAYVYSTLADGWTNWELVRNCGHIRTSDDALYMGGSSTTAYTQNNTKTAADFSDDNSSSALAVTVSSWDASTKILTLTSTAGVSVGDAVFQLASNGTDAGVVVQVIDGTTLLLSGTGVTFAAGAAAVYSPIAVTLQWRTMLGDPARWRTALYLDAHFRQAQFYSGTFTVSTDEQTTAQSITIPDPLVSFTSQTNWYPGMPVNPTFKRLSIPQEAAHGVYHNITWSISEAFALWWLNGVSVVFEPGSERTAR